MSRELQVAIIVALVPFAFFLMWSLPGYAGVAAAFVALGISILAYIDLQRRHPGLR